MKKAFRVATCAALLVAAPFAAAEDEEERELGWGGKLAFGFLSVSGNTESDSTNLDGALTYTTERWEHALTGRAIGQSQQGATTAEAYKAKIESRFDFTERTYAFGLVDWNKDRFSPYEYQLFEVVGLGRRIIDTPRHKLNGQVGFGATQNELQDGTDQNEFVTRLSGDYAWQISETAEFKQILNVNISSSNTFTESISELRVAIVGNVGLALSYTIRSNSDVPAGTENTDTWTAISLDYEF